MASGDAVTLQISHISKSFAGSLYQDVTLSVRAPAKIGLIGENGSGKSTLLKIIAGKEDSPTGNIQWGTGCKVGYLEQEIFQDAYDVSGGEKKIVRLAELFYSDYNVLLLDEPDNHLDVDHKKWFEELVQEFHGIVIVISHDRTFLTRAVNRIWLVEEGQVHDYQFGYEKFQQIYLSDMTNRQHLWEVQEKERIRLAELVRRLRDQAAANDKFVGRYHSAEKRYARFVEEMVEKPPINRKIKFTSGIDDLPARKTAIYIQDVHKFYENTEVLKGVNLHVFCGEKVAIMAPNGSGKSTLLNILSGRLEKTSGEVKIGPNLKIGYYTQDHLQALDDHATLVEELQKVKRFPHFDAVAYLKKFLFTPIQADAQVRFLSGGQKSRLQLAKFLSTNPEILVLDEPTNHLDIKTVAALENFLCDYEGALVLVSHDRELVEKTTSTWYELKDGQLNRIR